MVTTPLMAFIKKAIEKSNETGEAEYATVSLTPKDASALLTLNTHNRPVHDSIVFKYATEMQEGRWHFNGEAIKISKTGVMLDGQQRSFALSMCENVVITTTLVIGLEDETQSTMDTGLNRSLADILTLAGVEGADIALASGVRFFVQWDHDLLFADAKFRGAHSTKEALKDWALKHPVEVSLINNAKKYKGIPARLGVLMATYTKMVLAQGKSETVDQFFEGLDEGAGLELGSPILALRNRLSRMKFEGERITDRNLAGVIVSTFNHWRKGHKLSKIQLPNNRSWTKDNFPTITSR